MSIITKPSVLKGVPATFSLNKEELALHPDIVADSYFSDSENWHRVSAVYRSSPGSQYEIVEFNATLENPTGTFSVSAKARDVFQIQKLVVLDFDGGFLEIPRSSLTVAEFDIDFNSGGEGESGGINENSLSFDFMDGLTEQASVGDKVINKTSSTFARAMCSVNIGRWDIYIGILQAGVLKADISFKLSNMTDDDYCYAGIKIADTDPSYAFSTVPNTANEYVLAVKQSSVVVYFKGLTVATLNVTPSASKTFRMTSEGSNNVIYLDGVKLYEFYGIHIPNTDNALGYGVVYGTSPWKLDFFNRDPYTP